MLHQLSYIHNEQRRAQSESRGSRIDLSKVRLSCFTDVGLFYDNSYSNIDPVYQYRYICMHACKCFCLK